MFPFVSGGISTVLVYSVAQRVSHQRVACLSAFASVATLSICCSSGSLRCLCACLPFRLQACETVQSATAPLMPVTSLSGQRQVETREGKMLAAYRQIEMHTGVKGPSLPVVREQKSKAVELALTVTHDPRNVKFRPVVPPPPAASFPHTKSVGIMIVASQFNTLSIQHPLCSM